MGSGLIYLSIVVIWAAVLVPMWLKKITNHNEVNEVAAFNRSMAKLSSAPGKELPAYLGPTSTEIAAARRKRTVVTLSALTIIGSLASLLTGAWILMIAPTLLLAGFFIAAWKAVAQQSDLQSIKPKKRLDVSRIELAQKAKEWNPTSAALPNTVTGPRTAGWDSTAMLAQAKSQQEVASSSPEVAQIPTETVEIEQPRRAAGGN